MYSRILTCACFFRSALAAVSEPGRAEDEPEVRSPSSRMSERNSVNLQTESLAPGLERKEVMKFTASSYSDTADVVLPSVVSEDPSSRTGNLGATAARVGFPTFLAAFLAFFGLLLFLLLTLRDTSSKRRLCH